MLRRSAPEGNIGSMAQVSGETIPDPGRRPVRRDEEWVPPARSSSVPPWRELEEPVGMGSSRLSRITRATPAPDCRAGGAREAGISACDSIEFGAEEAAGAGAGEQVRYGCRPGRGRAADPLGAPVDALVARVIPGDCGRDADPDRRRGLPPAPGQPATDGMNRIRSIRECPLPGSGVIAARFGRLGRATAR